MAKELAGCIILDEQDRILLLHRTEPNQWEVPGGKLKEGETHEEAAIREAKEELGVDVELIRRLGKCIFHQGDQEIDYTWYLADIENGIPTAREEIFDDSQYFSLDEMRKQTLSTGGWNFLSMLVDDRINL